MSDIFDELMEKVEPLKPKVAGNVSYYMHLYQGTDEWMKLRLGLLTASEMKLVLTPTLKIANNDKTRTHLYELLAQRISQFVEPHYISDDMLRGQEDEVDARILYSKNFAKVTECGFVTNSKWGFTLGYSPDGLVGNDGLIEAKSRRQKYQVQTVCENVWDDKCTSIPADYVMQLQAGLLITEREWCDFLSYSNGLPMAVIRVFPDPTIQTAIIEAASEFERSMAVKLNDYRSALESHKPQLIPTERKEYQEIIAA